MSDIQQDHEYVPRAGEAAWTGLSGFKSVTLHGFVIDANRARLDETLQRHIDRPSQELGLRVDVTPAFSRVLLLFVDSVRFQIPPELTVGPPLLQGEHYEQLCAVLMFGKQRGAAPGLFAFTPYVYTSQTPGWRMEREIFGYQQQLADIVIPGDEDTPSNLPPSFDLRAEGIAHFAPDAISRKVQILSIEKKPDATQRSLSWNQFVPELVAALTQDPTAIAAGRPIAAARRRPAVSKPRFGVTAADAPFLSRRARDPEDEDPADTGSDEDPSRDELTKGLLAGALRMLFLKQFRDIVYPDRACYQAIVEAPLTMRDFGPVTASDDYRLTLNRVDAAPIGRELGVPTVPTDVALAFRVQLGGMEIGDHRTPGTVISNPFWNPATETATLGEYPRLPKYVDRGGEAVWRQPSLLRGARIYGFGIKVSLDAQSKVLDRYVNCIVNRSHASYGPNPDKKFHLVPCAGLGVAMLMFVEYDKAISQNDDDGRLGGVRYREFLVMQLAICEDPEFPELDWLIPFIYLDKDSPRLCGREIYGYPKQIGDIPKFIRFNVGGVEIEAAQRMELNGLVIPKASDTDAKSKPIVTIEGRQPPATLKAYTEASDLILDLLGVSVTGPLTSHLFPADVAGPMEATVPGSLGVDAVFALLSGNIGHVFLKQFRDCVRPTTACYQAICKTDTVPGRFRGGARIDPHGYQITISDCKSEPILEYLGELSLHPKGPITPDFAYWMDLDIELTTGRVIANALEPEGADDRESLAVSSASTWRRTGGRGPLPARQVRRSREPNL